MDLKEIKGNKRGRTISFPTANVYPCKKSVIQDRCIKQEFLDLMYLVCVTLVTDLPWRTGCTRGSFV